MASQYGNEASVLDLSKAAPAIAAYAARRATYCAASPRSADVAFTRIADAASPGTLDAIGSVCDSAATPVAIGSGAFFASDEVVLSVPSGNDRASGDHTLALMRGDGAGHYTFVSHIALGNDAFRSAMRFTRAGAHDTLMVCNESSSQGLDQSDCGVLTQNGLTNVVHSESESPPLEAAGS
jgi:hypothetical protein